MYWKTFKSTTRGQFYYSSLATPEVKYTETFIIKKHIIITIIDSFPGLSFSRLDLCGRYTVGL